jgi:hypothetical protein
MGCRHRVSSSFLSLSTTVAVVWMTLVFSLSQQHNATVVAFTPCSTTTTTTTQGRRRRHHIIMKALGDYTLELEKPLGMILEELNCSDNNKNGGVYVKEVAPGGAAAASGEIVPRDVLLQVDDTDVSKMDFDSVISLFIASETPTVRVTLGDGLGMMDMPKNVVNQLKSPEDAYFVDAVVRKAVREIRKNGTLGDVLNVEVIVGAGVQDDKNDKRRGMVRFFAIFSTDGVSTYSCNVSAIGVRQDEEDDNSIKIVSLSCAKDEGLGRTFDLIQEQDA